MTVNLSDLVGVSNGGTGLTGRCYTNLAPTATSTISVAARDGSSLSETQGQDFMTNMIYQKILSIINNSTSY